MKYAVVLCDGMADYPISALKDQTPMSVAKKPCMDFLSSKGQVGLVKTVPDGMKPGSDVANLSVMGYDPAQYYTGRSPLEAASIGIDLQDTDVTLRCNLVTLSEDHSYQDKMMVDYCADDISSQEATVIAWCGKMGGPILVLLLLPMTLPAAKLLNISQTGLMSQSFINSWCKAITF